jgi:hypothetical protein
MATIINGVEYDVDPATIEKLATEDSTKSLIKTVSGDKLSVMRSNTHSFYRKSNIDTYGIAFTKDDPIDTNVLKLLSYLHEAQEIVTFEFEEWNRDNGSLTLLDKVGNTYTYATHMYPIANLTTANIVINNRLIGDTTVTITSTDLNYGIVTLESEQIDLTYAKVYATYDVQIPAYISKLEFENLRSYNDLYTCNLVLEHLVNPQ